MRLKFVAKDPASNPDGSPTLCRTDRGSWVARGWTVTDLETLAQMDIPTGERVVEIPDRLVPVLSGPGSLVQLSYDKFRWLLNDVEQEAVHLETRDAYGTAVELPHMAQWAAGEHDDLEWLQGWCSTVRTGRVTGKAYRRARIVSEPLSEYQRWSYSIADPMVAAGG